MYVGGSFTDYNGTSSNYIIRLNPDGSVDTAFNIGPGFDGDVLNISPATDGSGDVYVGGSFATYNGTGSNGIIRLNDDGSVDTTFNVGTGFNNEVLSISPATDGSNDLFMGGEFTIYKSSLVDRIVRLN